MMMATRLTIAGLITKSAVAKSAVTKTNFVYAGTFWTAPPKQNIPRHD
jgi:hypothetical protein